MPAQRSEQASIGTLRRVGRGAYLAERGAHWILTVKGEQPHLYQQLTGLPWHLVPVADRDSARGHGRSEIRSLKILRSVGAWRYFWAVGRLLTGSR